MSSKSTSHFEWIDMLRGLSALAVVIFHVRVDLWCGWQEIHSNPAAYSTFDRLAAFLSLPTPFFGSAVMLFFLLSGFCIHFPHAADGRLLVLPTYLRRRFLRIYPPYLAAVVLTVLAELMSRLLFASSVSPPTTILKSVFMLQNYGADARQMSINPSLWSLPVEFELYLAYPIFLGVLLRYGLRISLLMAGLVSAAALGLSLAHNWTHSVYHPATNFAVYWIIWCGGAALAELVKREALPAWRALYWIGALLLLGVTLGAELRDVPVDILHLLWAAFYIFILWWGLSQPVVLQRLRSGLKKRLLFLGTISYSLYLIHFPFFHFCGQLWFDMQKQKPSNFLVALFFCAVSIPAAYFFYLCVEVPSHRLARQQSKPVPLSSVEPSGHTTS